MTRQGETFSEEYFDDLGPQIEWRYSDPVQERAYRRALAEDAADNGDNAEQQPEPRAMTREEFEQAQRAQIIAQGERMASPFWATPTTRTESK